MPRDGILLGETFVGEEAAVQSDGENSFVFRRSGLKYRPVDLSGPRGMT
jgi:hypothetical protein